MLAHNTGVGYEVTLACAIAVFILLPPAVFMPLLDSTIKNLVYQETRLVSSVGTIYHEVWFPFAFGFLFFAFLFPALRAFFQIVVFASLRWKWKIPQRGRIFRWSEELRIWSMVDVVVISGIGAYYRAAIPADVDIRIGAWCYILVALIAFAGDRALDRRAVWNAIYPDALAVPDRHVASCDVCELAAVDRRAHDHCPRCGSRLERSLLPRYIPAVTAVAAAIPLTIPAYSAAVMINDQLTGVLEHTVLGTVQLLADRGYWQFGTLLFISGVILPVVELVLLVWLLLRVRFPNREGLILRTRVYRVMHRMVRWPMIIPFLAAIAAPIVNFRGIDDIVAGPGATPLFLLIAFITLAVRLLEPRQMWLTAGEAE